MTHSQADRVHIASAVPAARRAPVAGQSCVVGKERTRPSRGKLGHGAGRRACVLAATRGRPMNSLFRRKIPCFVQEIPCSVRNREFAARL